jgi:hypothetical protein
VAAAAFGDVNGEGMIVGNGTTGAEFEDFQFSAPPHGSSSWANSLRSFLPVIADDSVFTHGEK